MNISQLLEVLKNPQVSLSISEKLLVGFSIALLSMTVVFIVLVVIAGIINLLQRENKSVEKTENKVINNEIDIKEQNENCVSITTEIEDMGALVGVITAAICAASGNSSNNIVVRKIVRSNNSKSSWESMKKSKV